jgi:hypothetical protein
MERRAAVTRPRLTLSQLRELIVDDIADGETVTANAISQRLRLGSGVNHYRVALTLERLAADGLLELKAGARHRYFRRPQQPQP